MPLRMSMPPNSEAEDSSIDTKELVFLLAIAGRIDAQVHLTAIKLDNDRYIYHAFSIVDSLSSSYSMFKYFFEVFISHNNDPKLMHQILTSPGGIVAIVAEALFLVAFSFLASCFDKEKQNIHKMRIAMAWPYFRDVMKAVKNAYKGWKVATQVLGLVGGMDLKFLVIPLGLVLGVLAAANRFWLHKMKADHKKKKKANEDLLGSIEKLSSLTEASYQIYLKDIKSRTEVERIKAFMSVTAGGLIDGLYLYMGVVSLAVFAPPVFLAMAIFSVFYTVVCVISRVYEEYDAQLQLQASQTRCQLALECKRADIAYTQFFLNQDDPLLRGKVSESIKALLKLHNELKSQITHSYTTSFLLGVKYGLAVYGVISAFLFMISSVFLITAVAFPPALLIAFIVSGAAFLLIVAAYALKTHYSHLQSQKQESNASYNRLLEMQEQFASSEVVVKSELFHGDLKEVAKPKASPKFTFQEWLEVLRCFFSGLSKGNNFATFVGTPLQDVDSHGHDHHAPSTMLMLQIASTVLFSIILALRALARGFGKEKAATEVEPSNEIKVTQASGASGEFPAEKVPEPQSQTPSVFYDNFLRFFPPQNPSSPPNKITENTIPGLAQDRCTF